VLTTPSLKLSITMTEIMEYLPIFFAISNLIFKYQVFGDFSSSDIVCTLIAVTIVIVPM